MSTMDKIFAGYAQRQATLEASDNIFTKGIAWIHGELVPLNEARIPLMDQGFMHGDLTYDVPAVWDGRFFRLDDHLDRLEASVKKMRMQFPISRDEIRMTLLDMLAKSGIKDAFVELIVTRGLKPVREAKPGEVLNNHLYLIVQPYVWVMSPEAQYVGGNAVIARTVRRIPPGSMDPTIKNLQWSDFTRGMFEAYDRGAQYPFLTDGDTNITEGSGFNVVFVKNNVIYTPDQGVLQGITRKSVIDAAKWCGHQVRVEHVPVEMAYEADEIFMCTTAGGIMPITTMDGKPVKDGKVGPVTKAIWDRYWAMHWEDEFSFRIDYQKLKL
ncbi:hypothetical protein HYE68_007009 [Fusarium pseudograminearum]|nr:hypothetical protein HYE68_007009 [Fusarium pseudograminearum]